MTFQPDKQENRSLVGKLEQRINSPSKNIVPTFVQHFVLNFVIKLAQNFVPNIVQGLAAHQNSVRQVWPPWRLPLSAVFLFSCTGYL